MKRTRFSEEQIVAVLKEAEAGVPVKELSRRLGVSEPFNKKMLQIAQRLTTDFYFCRSSKKKQASKPIEMIWGILKLDFRGVSITLDSVEDGARASATNLILKKADDPPRFHISSKPHCLPNSGQK